MLLDVISELPCVLRERIAYEAIATRMHDVYRAALYNATVLQNARFDHCRSLFCARYPRIMRCARYPRIMRCALVPSDTTRGLESHGLAWSYFPTKVMLVRMSRDDDTSGSKPYYFNVSFEGMLSMASSTGDFEDNDALFVENVQGVRVFGRIAVLAYAQAKYERSLRGILHHQAIVIQRMYRGACVRRARRAIAIHRL